VDVLPQDYSMALGARLRAVRRQLGMTLEQVEQRSQGRFKMIVVGSYERADRAITVQRLADLAEFYGVRTEQLLPGDGAAVPAAGGGRKLRIDLRRLAALPPQQTGPLARYASTIQSQRDDYNSKVLTIRERDLQSLAAVYDVQPDNLTAMLVDWGVLIAEPPDAPVQ
jgi:transcriptional regulator with XRE-family HTH domain